MLTPPPLGTYLSCRQSSEQWAPYDYLVGSASENLDCATCFYFDGIDGVKVFGDMLALVRVLFERFSSDPKVTVVRGDKNILSSKYSIQKLEDSASDERILKAIESVEFFPKRRSAIEDTWHPSVYFALSLGPNSSAFFYVNSTLSEQAAGDLLLECDRVLNGCAAYSFLFPAWFSPLGYYWGISVEPSYRSLGKWGKEEMGRLSSWRDESKIGVKREGVRTFLTACKGYIRDIYPIMLLGENHLRRSVGEENLADVLGALDISSRGVGGDKFMFRVPNDELSDKQRILDVNGVTISGRSSDR